jgi:hypothetical protein
MEYLGLEPDYMFDVLNSASGFWPLLLPGISIPQRWEQKKKKKKTKLKKKNNES